MSESFRATPPEQQWSSGHSSGYNGSSFGKNPGDSYDADQGNEVGRVVLVGFLGGLLSAAGYIIYRRLPDEQREKLHAQVRAQVQQRINELRQNFNI